MMRYAAPLLTIGLLLGCRSHKIPEAIQWAPDSPPAVVQAKPAPPASALPPKQYRVSDHAGILSEETRRALQLRLVRLAVETGVSIWVVTVPTVEPYDAQRFALDTAAAHKLEGILIFMAVKERLIHFVLGPAAQEHLSEEQGAAIVENDIKPSLEQDNYATALTRGVRAVEAAIREPKE